MLRMLWPYPSTRIRPKYRTMHAPRMMNSIRHSWQTTIIRRDVSHFCAHQHLAAWIRRAHHEAWVYVSVLFKCIAAFDCMCVWMESVGEKNIFFFNFFVIHAFCSGHGYQFTISLLRTLPIMVNSWFFSPPFCLECSTLVPIIDECGQSTTTKG